MNMLSSTPRHAGRPLSLSADEMRAVGYRVVDTLVQRIENRPCVPARARGNPAVEVLAEPLPEASSDPGAVLDFCLEQVLGSVVAHDHPRYFAMIPSPANFVSVMADTLAAGFNVQAGVAAAAPAAAEVERVALEWLRQLLGLPEGTSGLCTSGGAAASLIALHVAREQVLGADGGRAGAIYCTEGAHPVIARDARLLGLPLGAVRRVAARDRRMRVEELARAVAADRERGLRPFCVVANVGTTDTGAVDDLEAIAAVCRREGLWLHADGAYGAAAACTERGRARVRGLALCDSLAVDPHKWLFQPYELGCLLVRDPSVLEAALRLSAAYFQPRKGAAIDFKDRGLQLSRSFKALKLWMSLKVFGAPAFRAAVDHGLELAAAAAAEIARHPELRLTSDDGLGIVTFRGEPEGRSPELAEALQPRLAEALTESGLGVVNTTRVGGETVLRMCTIHPHTTVTDVIEVIRWLSAATRAQARSVSHLRPARAAGPSPAST
jgi:glutamate/tyrosine decarboxylase-like PLP-dependent enzyme